MATIFKEGKVEAKGYPNSGGSTAKSSKKFNAQVWSDGRILLLDSGRVESTILLNCDTEVVLDAKKKRFNVNLDADVSVVMEPDEDAVGWADAVTSALPQRYFGGEMSNWTQEASEVPEFVKLALEALARHTEVDGLFRISGSKPEIDALRRLYDSGQRPSSLSSYDVHTLTGALKLYLRLLPSPLVPFAMYNTFLGLSNSPDIASAVTPLISEFPLQNQVVLKEICQFVQKVGQQSSVNQMTYSNLAIVVAPNLVRPQVESIETATHAQHIIPLFTSIFEHADIIFASVQGGAVGSQTQPGANRKTRPISMGFPSSPILPPVPGSGGGPLPSLPPIPGSTGGVGGGSGGAGSGGPAAGLSSDDSAPSRRPISMVLPPGSSPLKLPALPPGGSKKGLRPTPGDGSAPGGLPNPNPSTTPAASSNPLPPAPGGPKKMAFLAQIQERQKSAAAAEASSGTLPPPNNPNGGLSPSSSSDNVSSGLLKSVSLSSIPKTPPGPFLKRPTPAVGQTSGGSSESLPPPSLPAALPDLPKTMDQAPTSLPPEAGAGAGAGSTLKDSKKDASAEDEALAAECAQWKTYSHDDGRKYYHNETTNTTTWEKPECLKRRAKKHRKNPSSTSSTREEMLSSTPSKPNAAKRKTDRAQTTTSAPNLASVNALAASMAAAQQLPPTLPPPVSAQLPPTIGATKPAATDSERIKVLEDKVAALERLVEQLMASRN